VFLRAAAKMPKERREEFIKVLEKNNEEQIGAFLKANCSNLDQLVTEESLKFKHFLINRSRDVDNKITLQKMTAATSSS
ncbi:MAG: hypothetical protein M1338_05560, partial [Patescibacteria group bacterium]|nr:hypothetical protein [Patescibacteria group bacterium]